MADQLAMVSQGSSVADFRAKEGCGLSQHCAQHLLDKLHKAVIACPEIKSPSPRICAFSWEMIA